MSNLTQGQQTALNVLSDWYNNKSSGNEIATLEGFAGTGKTFLTKHFIDAMGIRNPLVSAPTNKAKNVIQKMTNLKGKTIHSILGLRPDVDLDKFSALNPLFSQKGQLDIDYPLIVVDESSMINKDLYAKLKSLAYDNDLKILFMGDRYQLPPVKEKISKVFTDAPYKAVLDEIVRQEKTNPSSYLIEVAINDIKNNTNKLDTFAREASQRILPEDLNTSEGFTYLDLKDPRLSELFIADAENFRNNKTKYLAFTNESIEGTLELIRNNVLKHSTYIEQRDSLVGYKTVTIGRGDAAKTILTNSEEYNIVSINDCTLVEGMKGFQLLIENIFTKAFSYINIVDLNDAETYKTYYRIVYELDEKANKLKGRYWVNYFNFIHNNLATKTLYKPNSKIKLKNKEVDFSYGYTVHKSQGSTYTNCFINFTNMNSNFDKDVVRRLKYVAVSRAEKVNVIM